TINTMAICLDPDRFGQLLDPFGGREDLERGLIRVLHNFSFIEDPTRILRAVRFEQRFGFRIESRSAELVAGALDLLDNVSGDRLRHELFAILDEPEPERYLVRLQELGALAKIHPRLKIDEGISDQFRRLRADGPSVTALNYLAVLTRALSRVNTLEVASRLKLAKNDVLFLEQTGGLGEMERELSAREMSRSELVHRLADFQDAALEFTARVTAAPIVAERIRLYREQLAQIQPHLDGNDLKRLGVPPGPHYREILTLLRDQRLDGRIESQRDEESWVRKWEIEKR
ncbi:MAG TPA: hypothetical protein VIX58_09855, partial [Anaerolineae bacterium]